MSFCCAALSNIYFNDSIGGVAPNNLGARYILSAFADTRDRWEPSAFRTSTHLAPNAIEPVSCRTLRDAYSHLAIIHNVSNIGACKIAHESSNSPMRSSQHKRPFWFGHHRIVHDPTHAMRVLSRSIRWSAGGIFYESGCRRADKLIEEVGLTEKQTVMTPAFGCLLGNPQDERAKGRRQLRPGCPMVLGNPVRSGDNGLPPSGRCNPVAVRGAVVVASPRRPRSTGGDGRSVQLTPKRLPRRAGSVKGGVKVKGEPIPR